MKFEFGVTGYTVDGQNVGSVDPVLLDPCSNKVTHLVVQQGTFFSDRDTSTDTQSPTELPLYGYPFNAVTPLGLCPAYYPALGRLAHVETERNLPTDVFVLSGGASILSQGGKKVGTIERVLTDEKTDQATHLLTSRGWLFLGPKPIPVGRIDAVTDHEIHLASPHLFLNASPLRSNRDYSSRRKIWLKSIEQWLNP